MQLGAGVHAEFKRGYLFVSNDDALGPLPLPQSGTAGSPVHLSFMGLRYESVSLATQTIRSLRVSPLFPLVVCPAAFLVAFYLYPRRGRAAGCPACGYPRGAAGVCSECGAALPPSNGTA